MIVEIALSDNQKKIIEALGCVLRCESELACCDIKPRLLSKIIYHTMSQSYLDGFMFFDVPKRNALGFRLGTKMNDDGAFLVKLNIAIRAGSSVYLDSGEISVFEKLVSDL